MSMHKFDTCRSPQPYHPHLTPDTWHLAPGTESRPSLRPREILSLRSRRRTQASGKSLFLLLPFSGVHLNAMIVIFFSGVDDFFFMVHFHYRLNWSRHSLRWNWQSQWNSFPWRGRSTFQLQSRSTVSSIKPRWPALIHIGNKWNEEFVNKI